MLAPAGNPIKLGYQSKPVPEFSDYRFVWLNSGTAALALSILLSKSTKNVSEPEVIIPAYACPDLVSACAYAGVKCRLCDLGQNNTAFSLDHLNSVINPNTIAIIAINFLGIQEQLAELNKIATSNNIALIEDDAQWFPELNTNEKLTGDFVCLSFGRGKPVSLLGGGAVLIKQSSIEKYGLDSIIDSYIAPPAELNSVNLFTKCIIYNGLIQPTCYTLLKYIPGLTIGQTIYKPLKSIAATDTARKKLLGLNINEYINSEPTAQLYLQTHLAEDKAELISLPNKFLNRTKRLLRFPLLLEDKVSRDMLLNKMDKAGLGATKLYGKILPAIAGTEPYLLEYDDLPNATDLANRLITLPVHKLVKQKHLDKIISLIKSI